MKKNGIQVDSVINATAEGWAMKPWARAYRRLRDSLGRCEIVFCLLISAIVVIGIVYVLLNP